MLVLVLVLVVVVVVVAGIQISAMKRIIVDYGLVLFDTLVSYPRMFHTLVSDGGVIPGFRPYGQKGRVIPRNVERKRKLERCIYRCKYGYRYRSRYRFSYRYSYRSF